MSKPKQYEYYDIRNLIKKYPEAYYYMVIGERSNGKTFSALDYCLENYRNSGQQFAYVRRFGEDVRKKELDQLFAGHIAAGRLKHYFGDDYDGINYLSGKFRLYSKDDKDTISYCDWPIGHVFNLSSMEHFKSISYPEITTIVFDEFLTRGSYLPNEFLLFTNMISTIVRLRTNVKIIMLGNTVNKYCPYFEEMGLKHIKEQEQGTVDVYKYAGNEDLMVVVDYAKHVNVNIKPSDVYFAFDNPQLQMITHGTWEIAVYPHLPCEYKPRNDAFQFFVDFDRELLHGHVIMPDEGYPFIFFHRKTTPIKDDKNDIVYSQIPSHYGTHHIGFEGPDKLSLLIRKCLRESRVFYATNEIGEILRNYIMWCSNYTIKKAV